MKCTKVLPNGDQCQAWAQKDKELCFRHDPENKDKSMLSSRKGGQNRALQGFYGESVTLETPEDIKKFLGRVINAIWSEGVPVPVGSSMGFLARCWLDAYEAGDIQQKLDSIERKLTEANL